MALKMKQGERLVDNAEIGLSIITGLMGLVLSMVTFIGKGMLERLKVLEFSDSEQRTSIAILKKSQDATPTLEGIRTLLREEIREIKSDVRDTNSTVRTMELNHNDIQTRLKNLEDK